MDAGCPLVIRSADSRFTLTNFIRAQLYAAMSTLMLGAFCRMSTLPLTA